MSANHVIFGTGAIGRAIMEELLRRGESVCMVNRSGRMDEVPAGVEIKAADLYDPAQVKELTRGAKVVYQASQPGYTEWQEKFPPLQKSIIDGLTDGGAKLVLIENLYLYGGTNGKPMTEDTPHNAHTRKGKVRGEMSRAAFEAHRAGRLRVTACRGADYFGAWGTNSSMGGGVFQRLLDGKAAQVAGSTKLPHTHTYIPDFGKALVILGERAEADGRAWHVPNDMVRITQGEMVQMIAAEIGTPPKIQAAGRVMMSLLGLFVPSMREMAEMMYEFDQPFVVDSSRFEKTFGMNATPMKEAIRETVAWYKSRLEK